jgi:beta-galactosidase
MHDWVHVMLDGETLATNYRNLRMPEMLLEFEGDTVSLEILVHNLGRSNFGHLMAERKGITEGVFVGPHRHEERAIFNWTHHPLPLNDLSPLDFRKGQPKGGPRFFRGTFNVEEPADTFLKLDGFDFGCAFVNGVNLGRYWKIGPQKTLYVPGPMLKRGTNELVIFEAAGAEEDAVAEFVDAPQLG